MSQPQSSSLLSLPHLREFATERISPPVAAGLATTLVVLGIATLWPTVLALWGLWTTDGLKSIGMVVPVVSLLLILRVWRTLGWEMDGTWWGFVLLAVTVFVVRLRNQAVFLFVFSPQWSINLPPHSIVFFAYGLGAVLLFGGKRLVRAALFPLLLLLAVNPVPHIFNVYVDLPLQRASAHIARGFAIALGQPLSPDSLRLMFTPTFGMFIAPGCNGIRGAVTMGFIALIAGYLYHFRWRAHTLAVLAAIALGYLFNFVRLCVLVLYYLVALHWTWLQDRAEMGDYIIGAVLFLAATLLLFHSIQRYGSRHTATPEPVQDASWTPKAAATLPWRLTAMAVLAAFGCTVVVRQLTAPGPSPALLAEDSAPGQFPDHIGNFTRVRSWNENLTSGALLFHWAEYAADNGDRVSIGISPVLGSHDTLICHSARGEDPIWHGQSTFATADEPIPFSGSFFNDGATQYVEATTICNGRSCGEFATNRTRFGFVYSRPEPQSLFGQDPARPIPVLLKAETLDTTLPADTARRQLFDEVGAFLSAASLDKLTQPYRRR